MTSFASRHGPDVVDRLLVWTFLIGIYLDVAIQLSPTVPVPTVIAGIAGSLLLLKNSGRIEEQQLVALVAVVLLYLVSVLCVSDYSYLMGRLKGFIQITYSLVIGYGLFLTLLKYDRTRLARVFLVFCILILVGCTLENYTSFKYVSDAFRARVFDFGLYQADIRDESLYGLVRPKLFTSEPSAVSFSFTLFAFAWYTLDKARLKIAIYLGLMAVGYLLMRGPTLLLGAALVVPYEIMLGPRTTVGGRAKYDANQVLLAGMASVVVVAAAVAAGTTVYAARLNEIASGSDSSFFSREIAPVLTAKSILLRHPIAGAGLTGWEGIDGIVRQIYATAPQLAINWDFDKVSHALTNYFWDHWIFLGQFFGVVMAAALTMYVRALGTPAPAYGWIVWAIFGQASGGYVSPKTWFVMYLVTAIAILHQREPAGSAVVRRYAAVSYRAPRPGEAPT